MKLLNVFLSLFFVLALSVAASAQCSPAKMEACKAKSETSCAKMASASTASATPAATCNKVATTEASATVVGILDAIMPKESTTATSCCQPCPLQCCDKTNSAATTPAKTEAVKPTQTLAKSSL